MNRVGVSWEGADAGGGWPEAGTAGEVVHHGLARAQVRLLERALAPLGLRPRPWRPGLRGRVLVAADGGPHPMAVADTRIYLGSGPLPAWAHCRGEGGEAGLRRLLVHLLGLPRPGEGDLGRWVRLALTDHLTGLGNRLALDQALALEGARARRSGRCLTLILIDLDGFKGVNDGHGHGVGDRVLRQFAASLRDSLRGSDRAFRLGGDEFVLLPASPAPHWPSLAAHWRNRLKARPWPAGLPRPGFSMGAVSVPPQAPWGHILDALDRELYADKRARKGRCERSTEPPPSASEP